MKRCCPCWRTPQAIVWVLWTVAVLFQSHDSSSSVVVNAATVDKHDSSDTPGSATAASPTTSWDELDLYSKCRTRPTWRFATSSSSDEQHSSSHNNNNNNNNNDFAATTVEACTHAMEWKPRSTYWKAQTLDWFTKDDKEDEILDNFVKYDNEDRRNFKQGGIEQIMTTCVDATFQRKLDDYYSPTKKNNNNHQVVDRMKPRILQIFNYDTQPDESSLVQIDAAFIEEEAMAVEAVSYCVKKYFEEEQYIYRTFSQDDDTYHQDGNHVVFMDHFMQLLAPGVVAQIQNVAYLAWQTADGWNNGTYANPKTLGVRTTEHLNYNNGGFLSFHDDPDSVYTIVLSLRRPEEYIGGEFLVADWEGNNKIQRLFKGPRLSALVFVSEELNHAVGDITGGTRETFCTELWDHDDVPYGLGNRPHPDGWGEFVEYWNNEENDIDNEDDDLSTEDVNSVESEL